jgi:hypothetical protein
VPSSISEPAFIVKFLSITGRMILARIVAVQPKPSFLPFFADQRPRTAEEAGVNDEVFTFGIRPELTGVSGAFCGPTTR